MLLISKFLPRFLVKSGRKREKSKDSDAFRAADADKSYNCRVFLLDDTELKLEIKTSHKAQELLEKIFERVNIEEKDYFGVRYLDETQQTQWLIPAKTIASQLKTSPPHSLYFGVKFYAVDPCKLQEEITRYQFFLQVKRDIAQGRLPVSYELATELAAYAVQSELGDYDSKRHSLGYCSEFRFVPNQTEEFENRVSQLHRTLRGQVPAVAEYRYLEKIKWLEMYGVDLHQVQGEGNVDYFLGLTPTGIVVYRNKSRVGNYFWPRLSKITFKGKLFMVKVRDRNNVENTYAFECSSKQAGKHLWRCCIEHHAFFRLTSANESYRGKLFSLGSKRKSRKKAERSASGRSSQSESSTRSQPAVMRVPSKRYQRRLSAESLPAAVEAATCREEGEKRSTKAPLSIRDGGYTRDRGYQSAPESPRGHRVPPWEDADSNKGGLYTSGRDSPLSVHSEKLMFPSRRPLSGSESDAGSYAPRKSCMYPSDTESDFVPRHPHNARNVPESASESEAAYRRHKQKRHHSRKSTDSLPATLDAQAERMMRELNYAGNLRLKPNGSVSSMASEPVQQAQRRRRKRSRSPGNKKPPEELAQHFKYVDPATEGLTEDQLKDIAYTEVQTAAVMPKVKYSPRARHRHKSSKRRSTGELADKGGPSEEAPPPYNQTNNEKNSEYHSSMPALSTSSNTRSEPSDLKSPVAAVSNAAYTAPIVKTHPTSSSQFTDPIPHPVAPPPHKPSSQHQSYPHHGTYPSNNQYPPSNQYPSNNQYPNLYPPNNQYPPSNQYPSVNQYSLQYPPSNRHSQQYHQYPGQYSSQVSYSAFTAPPPASHHTLYDGYMPQEPQVGNSPGSAATNAMLPTDTANYNQAGVRGHVRDDSGLGTEQDNPSGSRGTPTGVEVIEGQMNPPQFYYEQVMSNQKPPSNPSTPSKSNQITPTYHPRSPVTMAAPYHVQPISSTKIATSSSTAYHAVESSPAPPSVPQRTHSLLPGGYNGLQGPGHRGPPQGPHVPQKYRPRNSGYHSDGTFFQTHSEKMTEL